MVTRDEVARAAGTSSAVVSYVMNGGPRSVSPGTRQRVLDAVQRLGYRPNALARALRSANSRVLGLIVPDITNPFFAELGLAIERAAFERGYTLFLGNAMHDDGRQAGYLTSFADHQVRGILLIGAESPSRGLPPATKAALQGNVVPTVFLDRRPPGISGARLSVDNRRGAYEATTHLIGHGHTAIGRLSGPRRLSSTSDRDKGWARALTEAGLDPERQVSVRAGFDRYEAYETAVELFRRPDRPTALFVHSDEQAIGVLSAAVTCEVRIPQDLAVVSFDGIRESALVHPSLTTVQQPLELAAERAVELLIEGITTGDSKARNETLPVALVVRESCGCPGTGPGRGPGRTRQNGGRPIRRTQHAPELTRTSPNRRRPC